MTNALEFLFSKPQTGFCTGYMDRKSFITRMQFFFIRNDRAIKWWIENGPDLWDMMQLIIDLIAKAFV